MSRKSEVFKRHNGIIELSRKISTRISDAEGIKDPKAIAALAEEIEKETRAALELTREILEEYEFDDFGPTE
ncbi:MULTISPECIES: hypothetical protein [Methylomicrobium]|uniref:Uncharacterized protein n=1 Tax=Methylomicrobium album BG8 TaxID=686340 RepID=H8GKE9_METAL|nr:MULTISPECIES: hypothetical protein [Methylomicrobium]EIC30440.1 hypothetical protein Metal_2741 [Methylomicrobium album BG8]